MQLKEIVNNVNGELLPASNIDDLIKSWANRAQKRFIRSAHKLNHNFSWLKMSRFEITTIDSKQDYALSPLLDLSKAISFYDEDLDRNTIEVISRREFQERYPDPLLAVGEPEVAYLFGYSVVQNQPTSASQLTFVSNNVEDFAVIKIEGLNENGVYVGEELTLNGTTPVVSVLSYTKVLNRGINEFTMGIVTITSNGGLVTNDVIQPRNRQNKYPIFRFYPVPNEAKTIFYDGVMQLPELVNDNDMSLIPEQYHDGIEDYCLYRGFRHKKDLQNSQEALASFNQIVTEAIQDDTPPVTRVIVGGGIRTDLYLGNGTLPGPFPNC